MKRFWNSSLLALAAVAGVTSMANAQNDWGGPSQVPSTRSTPSPMNLSSWGLAQSQDVAPAVDPGAAEPVANGAFTNDPSACGAACVVPAAAPKSNWVVGVKGLYFTRDHEDDVVLSRDAAGQTLLSTSANMNTMGGMETSLTKRNCTGSGIQFVYWGLYPGEAYDEIYGPGMSTDRTSMSGLTAPGSSSVDVYFDTADVNYVYRTNEFHNVEANLLRNVGTYTTRHGRNASYELLGGFRWFQFNEAFGHGAYAGSGTPANVEYQVCTENTLLGFQLGGRSEFCLTDRLSASVGGKIGAYNNHVNHCQSISDEYGNPAYRTSAGVDDYEYYSSKDDLSMLGELDLGMSYRVSCCSRVVWGYRVIGVSGIALAPNQIPTDFLQDSEINAINSNGDLIVGGGYAGFEFCF